MTQNIEDADPRNASFLQSLVGLGVIGIALGLGFGALNIPSAAGYAGVGPNFLPWLVTVGLLLCGAFMVYHARTGGFRHMEEGPPGPKPYWPGFIWMSAGLLANAALITTIGFVLSCALCFTLAVRGLRISEGKPAGNGMQTVKDVVIGMLISAPTFWLFTKFLAVNLPGLTGTGWL